MTLWLRVDAAPTPASPPLALSPGVPARPDSDLMLRPALAGLAVALAACAPAVPTLPAEHPAQAAASAGRTGVAIAALPPATPPDLPAALRPDAALPGHPDHGQMDHGQMDHGQIDHAAEPAYLAPYLALHDALAADRLDGVAASAQAFARAFALSTQTPPADRPHFWHRRATEVEAILGAASDLAASTDLASARAAFGTLSAPFADLMDALGQIESVGLARFTCGMATDLPDDGAWVQRAGAPRNPYFGARMLSCATPFAPKGRAPAMEMSDHPTEGHH